MERAGERAASPLSFQGLGGLLVMSPFGDRRKVKRRSQLPPPSPLLSHTHYSCRNDESIPVRKLHVKCNSAAPSLGFAPALLCRLHPSAFSCCALYPPGHVLPARESISPFLSMFLSRLPSRFQVGSIESLHLSPLFSLSHTRRKWGTLEPSGGQAPPRRMRKRRHADKVIRLR